MERSVRPAKAGHKVYWARNTKKLSIDPYSTTSLEAQSQDGFLTEYSKVSVSVPPVNQTIDSSWVKSQERGSHYFAYPSVNSLSQSSGGYSEPIQGHTHPIPVTSSSNSFSSAPVFFLNSDASSYGPNNLQHNDEYNRQWAAPPEKSEIAVSPSSYSVMNSIPFNVPSIQQNNNSEDLNGICNYDRIPLNLAQTYEPQNSRFLHNRNNVSHQMSSISLESNPCGNENYSSGNHLPEGGFPFQNYKCQTDVPFSTLSSKNFQKCNPHDIPKENHTGKTHPDTVYTQPQPSFIYSGQNHLSNTVNNTLENFCDPVDQSYGNQGPGQKPFFNSTPSMNYSSSRTIPSHNVPGYLEPQAFNNFHGHSDHHTSPSNFTLQQQNNHIIHDGLRAAVHKAPCSFDHTKSHQAQVKHKPIPAPPPPPPSASPINNVNMLNFPYHNSTSNERHSFSSAPNTTSYHAANINNSHSYHYTQRIMKCPPPPPPPCLPLHEFSNSHSSDPLASSSHNVKRLPPPPPPPPSSPSQYNAGQLNSRLSCVELKYQSNFQGRQRFCIVCDKQFINEEKYKLHIEEDHIPCDHPNCDYSAPIHVIEAHKLRHVKGKNGKCLFDDEQETNLWISSRKKNFPSKHNIELKKNGLNESNKHNNSNHTIQRSAIEQLLRSRFDSSIRSKNNSVSLSTTSALIPHLQSVLKRQRRWRLQDARKHQSKCLPGAFHSSGGKTYFDNKRNKSGREFTTGDLIRDFPICEHFLRFKTCKWTPCHFSHDIAAYRRWRLQRNMRGLDIPMRPPILYQLLLPSIREAEKRILKALQYITDNNFFRQDIDDTEENAHSDRDSLPIIPSAISEDSNSDSDVVELFCNHDDDDEDGSIEMSASSIFNTESAKSYKRHNFTNRNYSGPRKKITRSTKRTR